MKKKILSFVAFAAITLFTSNAFAQDTPGGESGGGGTPPPDGSATTIPAQPAAAHFTRNNGDGTCGDKAQIRMYYTVAPTVAPVLTQIYYEGQPLFSNFVPVNGNITDFASKGYVSFCLTTTNIPPAIKLTLHYNPGGTGQEAKQISGTD